MVWSCMTSHGIGYMTKIEGNLDAELYCNILHDELMQTLNIMIFKQMISVMESQTSGGHVTSIQQMTAESYITAEKNPQADT